MDDSGYTRIAQDEKNLLSNLIISNSLLLSSLFLMLYNFQNVFYYFIKVCVHLSILLSFFLKKKCSDTSLLCQLKPSLMSPTQFLWYLGYFCPVQGQILTSTCLLQLLQPISGFSLTVAIFLILNVVLNVINTHHDITAF